MGRGTEETTFSITDYGAKSGGSSDCSKAFMEAWDAACGSGGTVQVPSGTFLTGPVRFKGPCKGKVGFKTAGTVLAPKSLAAFPSQYWIVFERVKGLNMMGGTFDAQGRSSWSQNKCKGARKCHVLPTVRVHAYVDI
jgi:polygalacturonase